MSESDVDVIMLKLQHLEEMLISVHDEVKRTNGRVTELELEDAKWQGRAESRKVFTMIGMTVASGCVLAGIVWFVTNTIN